MPHIFSPLTFLEGLESACQVLLGVGEPRLQVHILLRGHVGLSSCKSQNCRLRSLRSTWCCPIHCLVVGIVHGILQANMDGA